MKKLLSLVAATATIGIFALANANPISVNSTSTSFTCNLNAAGACDAIIGGSIVTGAMNRVDVGLSSAGTLSSTNADVYDIGANNEENEITALNVLAGTSFVVADADKTNSPPADMGTTTQWTIDTLAAWVIIKIGAGHLFIENDTGGALSIVFSGIGTAGGVSHYTEVGGTVIPIPGAIWLMIAGLAGLGGLSTKSKKKP